MDHWDQEILNWFCSELPKLQSCLKLTPEFSLKRALHLALELQSGEGFWCLAELGPTGTPSTYKVVIKHMPSGIGKGLLLPKEN